jgi:hypothetical protein
MCRGAVVTDTQPLLYDHYRESLQHRHVTAFEKPFIFLALLYSYNEAIRNSHQLLLITF